ncbi:hybrid sensor histidine kinase/response regulator [Oscillatoria acuminata]|uniref:histidine kinase n=1 Tax=Oscillatoria acuminata PCC 6304 TaxID=56110 RepID=K9TDV1_9CYAN|nr:ATP-binding protein [Oscillatoria acuminata]AFY81057.1 histidine kinase,Response regulator receiver domain protein,histidine kinase [Oscillatoria acuminata PCC 6304]
MQSRVMSEELIQMNPAIALRFIDPILSGTPEQPMMKELSAQPVSILLIDDQPIVSEAIRRMLATETDIKFYSCTDPDQAIQIATQIQPTVILQDLVMGEIDGLMLLRFFRANPATRDIPIVVLSTKEEPEQKAQAFASGANDYLIKIPDKIELIARIRYHSNAYHNLCKRYEVELTNKYNQELELRVQERTQELTEALENLKQTQAQLVQSEKMSGLGQLVAGIAHEINNPISFISGNLIHFIEYAEGLLTLVELYDQAFPDLPISIQDFRESLDLEFVREDLPRLISSIRGGADRIREIVVNLRNFSRMDESERKQADLHEGIDSTLVMLQHRLEESQIELIKEYGELPSIECYPGQLNQVFINILTNAIDALSDRPEPSPVETVPRKISIKTELQGEGVAIRITDNGIGIPPELQTQIFNPFFTTKEVGQGTGLGLAISYEIIVKKHHGQIRCQSHPSHGTEFTIEIPLGHNKRGNLAEMPLAQRVCPLPSASKIPPTELAAMQWLEVG